MELITCLIMKNYSCILFIALIATFSCSKIDNETLMKETELVFYAESADHSLTRTQLQNDGSVQWLPNESINLFYGNKYSGKSTSLNNAPAKTVEFKGSISNFRYNGSDCFWAIYPYSESNTCTGNSIKVYLPDTQEAVDDSFDNNLFITVARSNDMHLAFYNVCGGIKFSINQKGVTSVTFQGNNNEFLAGDAEVVLGSDGRPKVKSISNGKKSLTLNAPKGGEFEVGKFYYIVSLPATLSKGYTMLFHRSEGDGKLYSNSNVSIKRSFWGELSNADASIEYDRIIEFSDDLVKQVCVSRYDSNKDGELSLYEAKAVQSIPANFFGSYKTGIVSFEELKFFSNLTRIEPSAFEGCKYLSRIILPENLMTIESRAFKNCSSLSSLNFPERLTSIGYEAFRDCSSLETIILPNSCSSIDEYAFCGCASLTKAILPDKISTLSNYLFTGCRNLPEINIPASVTTIGYGVFWECVNLEIANLPANLTSLGVRAFAGTSLKSLSIPDKIVSIPNYCFQGVCATELVIPKNIVSLGECSFSHNNIHKITIENENTIFDDYVFSYSTSIEAFYGPLASDDHKCLISKNRTLICLATNGMVEYTIPEGIIKIAPGAALSYDDNKTFQHISFPESIEVIGRFSFCNCVAFREIVIPDSVKLVEASAFRDCKLDKLVVGKNANFEHNQSGFWYIVNVKAAYMRSNTPPKVCPYNISTLYVPIGTKSKYEQSSWNSKYTSSIIEYTVD